MSNADRFDVRDARVIVTGAGSGLGLAMAEGGARVERYRPAEGGWASPTTAERKAR